MPSKKHTARFDSEIKDEQVRLAVILDVIDGKINLAEYEGLYALEELREALVTRYASIPKSLDYLVKRAHEAVDESALNNDQANTEHAHVEECEKVLRHALSLDKQ